MKELRGKVDGKQIMQELKFWKGLLGFINMMGAKCAQEKREWVINDTDKPAYFEYMQKRGADIKELRVEAAFYRLCAVDLKKEKKKIIQEIKNIGI